MNSIKMLLIIAIIIIININITIINYRVGPENNIII